MDLVLTHLTCFVRGPCKQYLHWPMADFFFFLGSSRADQGGMCTVEFWRMQQAMKVRLSSLGALFHAAAFGISTGPQGLSTWRIAGWHSHTNLKHPTAPAPLSLWHSLSSSVFPPVSLYLCIFNPVQIFSTGFNPHPQAWLKIYALGPRVGTTHLLGMSKVRKQDTRQFMSLDLERGSRVTLACPPIHQFCRLQNCTRCQARQLSLNYSSHLQNLACVCQDYVFAGLQCTWVGLLANKIILE